ncbi:hypothetical protein Fmac_032691 [Flemingia macrophylla]|uniref:Cysteine protease n=1 Tax=Flemingia macrophylla TaxID=520843 RepID=A0ABD1L730_9FABA
MLRYSLLALLFLAAVAAAAVSDADDILIRQVVSDGEEEHLLNAEQHFSNFKARFGKSYATKEEHDLRFGVFKSNLRRARLHAKLDPSAVHGVTKFSDLTPAEFRRQFLGLKPLRFPAHAQKAPILPTNDLPKDFDWRDKGAVTNVKDQGSCGSCWSFSTTGALEGAHYLATGELVSLSEQQLVDCDHVCDPEEYGSCDAGCNGGLMNNAFEYILESGGIQQEKDYPYAGRDGTCKFDKSKIAASVSNYSVVSLDEEQIAANLVKNGPLAGTLIFGQKYTEVFLALTSAERIWIMGFFLSVMVKVDMLPLDLRKSLTGSLRTHGGRTGERMDITRSAEAEMYVEWIPWSQR